METRHLERQALYHIIAAMRGLETLEEAEALLRAIMEQDDVELVVKAVDDLEKLKKKK